LEPADYVNQISLECKHLYYCTSLHWLQDVKAHNKPLPQKQFRETKQSQNCSRCGGYGGEYKSYITLTRNWTV